MNFTIESISDKIWRFRKKFNQLYSLFAEEVGKGSGLFIVFRKNIDDDNILKLIDFTFETLTEKEGESITYKF